MAKRKQILPERSFPRKLGAVSVDGQKVSTWWFSLNSVQRSMVLSIVAHLLVAICIWLGAFSMAESVMAKVVPELIDVEALKKQEKKRRSLIFLEVPPSMASEETPEDADHYSNNNSQAADKQEEDLSNKPKIEGLREEINRIIDNPEAATPKPPQPEPKEQPKPEEKTEPEIEPKPKPKEAETLNPIQANPEEKPKPKIEPKPQRPSSLAEARRMAMITGEKMKQDGGIRQRANIEGLDAETSPFGDYDARLIAAIQDRWYKIIPTGRDVGRVVITFNLWEDGNVTDIEVERSTVSSLHSLKCERAVREPAPYDPWPNKMREIISDDHRFVRFTFHYN